MDFLLPWSYPDRGPVDLTQRLEKLGFRSARNSDGSNYFVHPELKLEFLIPERGRGGLKPRTIKPLGMRAISLRFMDMLRKDSILINECDVRVLEIVKPADFNAGLEDLPRNWRKLAEASLRQAWDLLPLERPVLSKHGLAPQGEVLPGPFPHRRRSKYSIAPENSCGKMTP